LKIIKSRRLSKEKTLEEYKKYELSSSSSEVSLDDSAEKLDKVIEKNFI